MANSFRETDKHSWMSLPRLTAVLGLALGYFALARLGLLVASVHGNVSPVWPATGLAIGALLLGGYRLWPGVALGAFAANAFSSITGLMAAAIAFGNTLEAVGGAWLIIQVGGRLRRFRDLEGAISVIAASVLAPVVSASVGVVVLHLGGAINLGAMPVLWKTWWVGDALGGLIVVPLIQAMSATWKDGVRWSGRLFLKAVVLFTVCAVVCGLIFLGRVGNGFLFAVFPLLLIAVTWFGATGVRLTGFLISAVGIASAFFGTGPFVDEGLNSNVIHLQFFLISVAFGAIILPNFRRAEGQLLAFGVVLVGCALSGWMFSSLNGAARKVDEARFAFLISTATERIERRLGSYQDALQAGAAFFAASEAVGRAEWAAFERNLKVREKYPGALGIGVAFIVRQREEEAFLARVRAEAPDFSIKRLPGFRLPEQGLDGRSSFIVTYLEPGGVNRKAIGLDLASEERRAEAAISARDSGVARLTRRIQLVQDSEVRSAALLLVPIYRKGAALETMGERQAACIGWINAPIVLDMFLQGVLSGNSDEIALRFYEGKSVATENILFSLGGARSGRGVVEQVKEVQFSGVPFTLVWTRGEGFVSSDHAAPVWAATSAAVVSLLLAVLVMSLQSTRRKAEEMVRERTVDLEKSNQHLQREVFERQRMEHSMRESYRLQQAILNSANYSIISTTPDGIILTFNAGAERLLGYLAKDVVGKVTPAIIHDGSEVVARSAVLTKELGFLVEPGFEAFVAKAKIAGIDEQEWTYIRQDKTRFPVQLSVTALRNENQVITGYLGVGQDLTVRKEAEARTRQALDELARQKFALDQHAIVAVTDVDGTITYANDRFCAISGYSRAELVGQNHRLLKSGMHQPEFYREMFASIGRGEVWQGEICNRAKDGSLYWESSTIVPFYGLDGKPNQFVAIRTDITERKRAAESTAQSERFIRAVTDGLPGLVAYWTADLRCTFANRAYREWFGLPAGPLEGMRIADVIGEGMYRVNRPYFEGALRGEAQAFERTLTKANGEIGHTWSQYVPDFGADGKTVKGFFVLISDVTDVKRKGEALRESARRMRLAADAAGIAIWEWNIKTNRLVWDARMFELYGLPPTPNGETEYATWAGGVLHEDLEDQEAILRETLRKSGHRIREFRIRRPGESKLRYIHACEDVIHDEDGRVVGVVGVNMDITERKEAERLVYQSEERTRLFAEHTPASVAMFDLDMRYLVVSRQWVSDNKLEGQGLIGRSHYDVFPGIPERWKMIYQRCLEGAVETSESDRLEWIEGSAPWLRWEVRPWYKVQGGIGGIVMFTQDITMQKELEGSLSKARDDALEASRLKSEFLATMSHEIRTPMNGIIGMANLLLQSPLEDKQREMAQVVVRSSQGLLAIINDILDFSKIEAGKFRIDPVDFNLRDSVEEAVALLAPQAFRKNLELVCDIDPLLPTHVNGDSGRIQQVLINLLGNALKFTETGEVRVVVRALPSAGTRMKLRIEVKDTGIGIADSARVNLFRPFTQGDGSTTRRFGGSGLGLAISHQLATLMGGQLGFESTEGIGSSFWFEVALALAVAPMAEAGESLPADGRILVFNENKASRAILVRQITSLDVRCEGVAGVDQAIALLHQAVEGGDRYMVAIIDWDAAEQGGLLLAQAIRSDAIIATTRLIALTATQQSVTPPMITDLNLCEVLGKPVRNAQLRRCLLRAFGRRETPTLFQPKAALGVRGLKLLLAEDNPTNQLVAQMMLEQYGHTIDVAGNGQEAIDRLASSQYDAILMDCQMPVVDGYEATRRIRGGLVPGGNSRIPIIALTAYAMPGDRAKVLAAGMDDYVSKPLDSDALLAAFARCGLMPKSRSSAKKPEASLSVPPLPVLEKMTVIDPVRRERLSKIKASTGGTLWDKVLGSFLHEMPSRVESLAAVVGEQQGEKLAGLAHALVGGAASIGANELHRVASALEVAAREQNWGQMPATILDVEHAWKELQAELAALVEKS